MFLRQYGFEVDESRVIETVRRPNRLDHKENQYFATSVLDKNYGLRVVYERRKGYLVVITFYPVRRERYGV
jgi:hypothetical protein